MSAGKLARVGSDLVRTLLAWSKPERPDEVWARLGKPGNPAPLLLVEVDQVDGLVAFADPATIRAALHIVHADTPILLGRAVDPGAVADVARNQLKAATSAVLK